MTELNVSLLPWQQEVFEDETRFKVIAAGRRTGKSRLAAWMLIIRALQTEKGHVFYVAPTQGQARDIMWQVLLEIGHPVIASSHVNNLQIKLVNGATIALKGADRPETMRGVSLKFLVMDEYADMKPEVWEQILRPALADQKGDALFIGTPMGRNHFYDLYTYACVGEDPTFAGYHFTSYDNPLLDPEEIEAAKNSMSAFSFRQEFMASFEAQGSELFKEEYVQFSEEEPQVRSVTILLSIWQVSLMWQKLQLKLNDLTKQLSRLLKQVKKVGGSLILFMVDGVWKPLQGKSLRLYETISPVAVGIEKGALKNAVLPYISDLMKSNNRFFRIDELTHGNKKKTDRIVWALQGRFEHGKITLNKGEWNATFLDELFQFPNQLVHDDLIDSLAYIDQLANIAYTSDYVEEEHEFLDVYAGY